MSNSRILEVNFYQIPKNVLTTQHNLQGRTLMDYVDAVNETFKRWIQINYNFTGMKFNNPIEELFEDI